MRRPLLAVVLALVAGLSVLVAPSSPAVAADEVTVIWPSVTAFNPDATTYEVTVDDPVGTGVLMAWWRNEPGQVIDGHGTTALTFGATGVGSVLITRCPASSASYPSQCWGVGQSGELSVYDRLIVGPTTSVVTVPGPARTAVTVEPAAPFTSVTGTWTLLDQSTAPATTLASGDLPSGSVVRDGRVAVPFTVPPGLGSGRYLLRTTVSADSPAYGVLTGATAGTRVTVDLDPPVATLVSASPVVYPIRDRYLDVATWAVRTKGASRATVDILNSAGSSVFGQGQRVRQSVVRFTWGGVSDAGGVVPEGRYTARLTFTDTAENSVTLTRDVTVSHLERRLISFRRTVTAAAALSSKFVGRCSTLTKRKGGALAYLSQSRCAGAKDDDSVVVARHGIYLPRSLNDHYTAFRLTVRGGPASRSSRNYLVLGYLLGKDFVHREVLRGGQRHLGDRVMIADGLVYDRTSRKPYVLWSTGLTSGSRFVVRSFTVEVNYVALTYPGSRVSQRVVAPGPDAGPRAASYL